MKNFDSYQNLFGVFNTIGSLSAELKNAIVDNSKIVNHPKGQLLLAEGEKSGTIYFIVSGAVRIYYLNSKGEETNTWFLFENEMLISVYGFFTSNPSFEYMQSLEDCTLIAVKKEKLDWLYENFLEFNIIGRRLTELYYVRNEAQTNALRMLSARERYEQLIVAQPKILQRVSLTHIASYLGISRETLSRIRRK